MRSNNTDFNRLKIYRLYLDDIEEIFFSQIPLKYLSVVTVIICLFLLASILLLIYRSRSLFLPCIIPFVYSLLLYDLIQLLSIILLRYGLTNIHERYFGEICRWPYYLKATAEAGQCLTLIFIYGIRSQKIRYFLKYHHLPNSVYFTSHSLIFVCVLFIIYVNNWITHLKVEKIHLVTLNESNYNIHIQEYPITFYGVNRVKLENSYRYYSDLNRYAQSHTKVSTRPMTMEEIMPNHKDDATNEIFIKIHDFFGQNPPAALNRTRRDNEHTSLVPPNTTVYGNNSYRMHRCTYGQRNFFLTNLLTLIHSGIYFLLLSYFLTTIYRYRIPHIITEFDERKHSTLLTFEQKKSMEYHKQILLLAHLRRFQYVIACCHTTFALIHLIYVWSFTFISCLIESPLQWPMVKTVYYLLFVTLYNSIPIRVIFLFLYIFLSLYGPYVHAMFYYAFCTKLHFLFKFQKPSIRFRLHIVKYHRKSTEHMGKRALNSLGLNNRSSSFDEIAPMYHFNEATGIYEECNNSHAVRTSSWGLVNDSELSKM